MRIHLYGRGRSAAASVNFVTCTTASRCAWCQPLVFRLTHDEPWTVELDTAESRRVVAATVELAGRSLALLSTGAS